MEQYFNCRIVIKCDVDNPKETLNIISDIFSDLDMKGAIINLHKEGINVYTIILYKNYKYIRNGIELYNKLSDVYGYDIVVTTYED